MEMFEQFEEELGQTFEIPELDSRSYPSTADFLKAERHSIMVASASALHSAVSLKLPYVPVFAFKGIDLVARMEESEYLRKFSETIEYFQDREEYELCAALLNLKNKYENRLKRKKK